MKAKRNTASDCTCGHDKADHSYEESLGYALMCVACGLAQTGHYFPVPCPTHKEPQAPMTDAEEMQFDIRVGRF